ncbi:hypothetical protein JZ751_006916 [Albula glossodonta]|uniref:Uncharacterized protein n=1 Tax=Albula glossodonta TaxID=121402 RepID=A0A8T2P208_9TELE|nr:hypothetical protein JZ751_006916 [Albula glossodonta]
MSSYYFLPRHLPSSSLSTLTCPTLLTNKNSHEPPYWHIPFIRFIFHTCIRTSPESRMRGKWSLEMRLQSQSTLSSWWAHVFICRCHAS